MIETLHGEEGNLDSLVGITATVPVEILLAAGYRPVDLNNLFINSENPESLIYQAERAGFSHGICSWIKGIYSTVMNRRIKKVIAVTGGDCSNTIALGELLEREGVEVIPFEYPLDRSRDSLSRELEKLRRRLGTSWRDIEKARSRLAEVRDKLEEIDRLTYQENLVTGLENHLFLVASSDFNGSPEIFDKELDQFLGNVNKRTPVEKSVRLGYLGVPTVYSDFYELIESFGARVVFNEVQRQFSMPFRSGDLVEQYLKYTYPYDAAHRLMDIQKCVKERRLDGLIHYTQTFCYRQIYDIIIREKVSVPLLTIEGDRPGRVDSRTALRIETFIEMVSQRLNSCFL